MRGFNGLSGIQCAGPTKAFHESKSEFSVNKIWKIQPPRFKVYTVGLMYNHLCLLQFEVVNPQ